MPDSSQEKDPSIEEILASIRQIISDDEEEATDKKSEEAAVAEPSPAPVVEKESQADIDAMFDAPAPEPEPEPEPEPGPDDNATEDVLELTQKVEEDGSLSDVAEEEPEEIEPETSFVEIDLEDSPAPVEDDIVPMPEEPKQEAELPSPPPAAPETNILTQNATAAALAGFTKLAKEIQISQYRGVTLEDIVRSQVDPMLRDWLDRHLPTMIETLVREELEKISRKVTGE